MDCRAADSKPSDAEEEPAIMVEPTEKSKKLATIFKTAGRNAQEQSEALPYVARTQRTYQQCNQQAASLMKSLDGGYQDLH